MKIGEVLRAGALVGLVATCGSQGEKPTINASETQRHPESYRWITAIYRNGQILVCYSDRKPQFREDVPLTIFIPPAFCPNPEANKEILGSEETIIDGAAVEFEPDTLVLMNQWKLKEDGISIPPVEELFTTS